MNFQSIKAALNKAAQQATSAAYDLSAQVVGAKVLRDYTLSGQVATGGSGGLWKIYDGRSRKEGAPVALVSVWMLEKRAPAGMRDAQQAEAWESLLELCRKDVGSLAKLKHPGVCKLVEPFEETRSQMVMVTERVTASLANVLSGFEGLPPEAQRSAAELQMSDLERKHGLLQVADTLQFLHQDCALVHRAVCPDAIMVVGGHWKLALMGFAVMAEFSTEGGADHALPYDAADSELKRLLKPPLRYVAPELVASSQAAGALSSASDTYSFGVLAYEVLAGKPLMAPRSTPEEVAGRLAGLSLCDMAPIDLQLQPVLRSMLSPVVSQRQAISTFVGSPYFQEDTLVRALRFLDTLLQRDSLQKAAFLKDFANFWPRFDARILRYKVLPALLEEVRNEAVAVLALPLVLRIVTQQAPRDFLDFTLPILLPVAASAKGEALTLLAASCTTLAPSLPPEAVTSLIVPLLARAADHGDARAQEEMLKAVPALAELGALAGDDLAGELLPRVCGVCLATTSAVVRTGALMAMGRLVKQVEEEEAATMLAACQQVTTVDKTPGTVMCVLGLGGAVARRWGPELAATHVLPVLTPLLVAPTLTQAQFGTAMRSIREMLASVEAFRNGNTQSAEQSFSPISPAASEGRLSAEPSSAAGTGGGGSGGAATMSGFSSGGPSGGSGGASGAPMQQSSQQGAASNDPFNMLGSLTGSLREPSGSVQPVGSLADLDFGSSASAAGPVPRSTAPIMGKAPDADFGDFSEFSSAGFTSLAAGSSQSSLI